MPELSEKYKALIWLKKELYQNNWDTMTRDLVGKLEIRPYVYDIVNQIQLDLPRIKYLKSKGY